MDIDKLKAGTTVEEKIEAIREYLEEFQTQYEYDISHISPTNLSATGATEVWNTMMKDIKQSKREDKKTQSFVDTYLEAYIAASAAAIASLLISKMSADDRKTLASVLMSTTSGDEEKLTQFAVLIVKALTDNSTQRGSAANLVISAIYQNTGDAGNNFRDLFDVTTTKNKIGNLVGERMASNTNIANSITEGVLGRLENVTAYKTRIKNVVNS